jgi:cytochrome P450
MYSNWSMVQLQPHQGFVEQRKVMKKAMGPQAAQSYDGIIEAEAARLVEAFSGYSGDPFHVFSK